MQGFGAASGVTTDEDGQAVSLWTIVLVLGKFCYLFLASLALGLCFGLFTSWLMKFFKSNSTPQVPPQSRQQPCACMQLHGPVAHR